MRRFFFTLLFITVALPFFAQKAGDLYIGANGGYIPRYKDFAYGLNASYNIIDPFEVGLNFLTNPDILMDKGLSNESKINMYSLNLDLNYYILMQRSWAMGPTLGGQYFNSKERYKNSVNDIIDKSYGLNVGWRLQINFTENFLLKGGWRYSTVTDENSYHLFYLSLGYCFNFQ